MVPNNADTPPRIVIVGGGPAGAATALALLGEARRQDTPLTVSLYHGRARRRWPVGETVPPAAHVALAELGLAGLLNRSDHSPCPGSVSVWGSDKPAANDFMMEVAGTGYHLDRTRFDTDLLEEAERRGACIHTGHTLRRVKQEAAGFDLVFQTGRGERRTRADFVVDASGQSAAFARRIAVARNTLDDLVGLFARVPESAGSELPDYTLIEAVPSGWWYLARVPGGDCILSLTTDASRIKAQGLNTPEGWRRAYGQARWLNQYLPPAQLRSPVLEQAPAHSSILTVCVGERWLAVGDAASSYDPLTSAGITKAVMQATTAGRALATYLATGEARPLGHYQDGVFADFNQYVGLRAGLYARERRFDDSPFWRARRALSD